MIKRIQRKRTKGWRMPPNTLSVCRPGKWGNPLKLTGRKIYLKSRPLKGVVSKWNLLCEGDLEKLLLIFEKNILSGLSCSFWPPTFELYKDLFYWNNHFAKLDWSIFENIEHIACFCKEDKPCHADTLIHYYQKYKNKELCSTQENTTKKPKNRQTKAVNAASD